MSGYFDIVTSNQYIFGTVSWYEYGIDKANNKSWVHAELRLSRINNYTTASSYGNYYLTIDGQTFSAQSSYDNKITLNSNTLVISAEKEVYHDSNGTKTISIGVSADVSVFTISEQYGTAVLSTIPRESSLKFGAGTIESVLPITVERADGSFLHNIKYVFGSLIGTVAANVGDYYEWYIPSDFYSQIPNSYYGVGTIICETYSNGIKIGEKSYGITVYCDEQKCKPTLNATLIDNNQATSELTGSTVENVILVDYKSIAKFVLSYSAKNSAYITAIYFNGVSQQIGTEYELTPSSDKYTILIRDSRGYENVVEFQSNNVNASYYFKRIKYIPLTINPKTSRSTQIGDDMFVTITGNYFSGYFTDSVINTLKITWKVREKDGIWTNGITEIIPTITENKYLTDSKIELINPLTDDGTWNYQKIYEFEFVVYDLLMSKTGIDTRPKGEPNFAIFKDSIKLPGGQYVSSGVTLWTNPNPTNHFGDQTIELNDNIENYRYFEIVVDTFAPYQNYLVFKLVPTVFNVDLSTAITNGGQAYLRTRQIYDYGSGNSISFGKAYETSILENTIIESNEKMVPVKIIGYK